MFSGKVTRSFALCVVLAQVMVSVILAAVIPAPQSMARESDDKVKWEPSDIMLAACDLQERTPFDGEAGHQVEMDQGAPAESAPAEAVTDGIDGDALSELPADGAGLGDGGCDAGYYSGSRFRQLGVIYEGGVRYTWYSQKVLPGDGLSIEGRHVSDEGYVVDAQERIVVASSDLPQGTELAVPFGAGRAIVLDSGCASGTIDVYTDF